MIVRQTPVADYRATDKFHQIYGASSLGKRSLVDAFCAK
jgi:hypothetical protein